MVKTLDRDQLAAALAAVAHARKWCKHSDFWNALAHGEGDEDDDRLGRALADELIATSEDAVDERQRGAAE